jgi:hypothetical protein
VRANRAEIDAFVDYNYEQGLTRQRLGDTQIFSQSTLDT